jgi:hypothetical protein
MGQLCTDRKILSLILALSVVLWAEGAVAMLSAADHPAQCARMQHAATSMPCCPSDTASFPANFAPPPCCDLSTQPARPLAFIVIPSKYRLGQLSVSGTAGVVFAPPLGSFARSVNVAAPSFVKPVFDLKTDLRI